MRARMPQVASAAEPPMPASCRKPLTRRSKTRGRLLGLLAVGVALALPGCTLSKTGAQCESITECREAFGPGTICSSAGLCEPAPQEATCQNQFPADLLVNREKYKDWTLIGSLLRATGKEGARHDAAKLAVQAVNRFLERDAEDFPEVSGLRFGLIQCDHDGDTEEVARLADYLANTLETELILGPASSSRSDAAFRMVNLGEEVEGEEVEELRRSLFISPSATSVALTDLEKQKPGFFWRTAPMDDGQGRLMGAYATEQGMPMAVFYEDTTYGRGLYAELQGAAQALCDDCGISFEASSPDIAPLTRALASNEGQRAIRDASTVYFIGSQETHIRLMLDEINAALAEKTLFFSDAAANAETLSKLSSADISRVLGTRVSPPPDSETLRFFVSDYEEAYEESPLIHSFTANSYDATWLLLVGSIWSQIEVGEVTPEGTADGLGHLSDAAYLALDEDECPSKIMNGSCTELSLDRVDLDKIIRSFSSGRAINVTGASGSLDYCKGDEELVRELSAFELWTLEELDSEDQAFRIVSATDSPLPKEALPPCPAD